MKVPRKQIMIVGSLVGTEVEAHQLWLTKEAFVSLIYSLCVLGNKLLWDCDHLPVAI